MVMILPPPTKDGGGFARRRGAVARRHAAIGRAGRGKLACGNAPARPARRFPQRPRRVDPCRRMFLVPRTRFRTVVASRSFRDRSGGAGLSRLYTGDMASSCGGNDRSASRRTGSPDERRMVRRGGAARRAAATQGQSRIVGQPGSASSLAHHPALGRGSRLSRCGLGACPAATGCRSGNGERTGTLSGGTGPSLGSVGGRLALGTRAAETGRDAGAARMAVSWRQGVCVWIVDAKAGRRLRPTPLFFCWVKLALSSFV